MIATLRPAGASVRFDKLSKRFGAVNAVCSFTAEISSGEFFTVLGPSGSGKTTILMLIAGFLESTAGEIYLDGTPISRMPVHAREIGVVFQNYSLFPHMTVAQNIAFPLRLRGTAKSELEKKVDAILELVQLRTFRDCRPDTLSGGQQQRVALARALVFDPKLLLMDEPFGALDKALREQLQLELKELHQELRTTIINVTHDQEEALALSDRLAVLNAGKVEQIGTPEALYEKPATRFVATFIGQTNLLAGEVVESDGTICTVKVPNAAEIRVVSPVRTGVPVEILVRPQYVTFGDRARRCDNCFEGRIRRTVYSGQSLSVEVEIGARSTVTAWLPRTSELESAIGVGEQGIVGFSAHHARLFPADFARGVS